MTAESSALNHMNKIHFIKTYKTVILNCSNISQYDSNWSNKCSI